MPLTNINQLTNRSINQKGLKDVLVSTDIICQTEKIANELLANLQQGNNDLNTSDINDEELKPSQSKPNDIVQNILRAKSFSRNIVHLEIEFRHMNTFKKIEGELLIAIRVYAKERNYPEIKNFRLTLTKELDIIS